MLFDSFFFRKVNRLVTRRESISRLCPVLRDFPIWIHLIFTTDRILGPRSENLNANLASRLVVKSRSVFNNKFSSGFLDGHSKH